MEEQREIFVLTFPLIGETDFYRFDIESKHRIQRSCIFFTRISGRIIKPAK